MPQSLINLNVHFTFSTLDRIPLISTEWQPKLWGYLNGIAKNCNMKALAIGGTRDHVHILASLPATLSAADAVKLFKANSSRWMRENDRKFAWQKGYAAFSVSRSNIEAVRRYINNQEAHHRRRDFKAELIALLEKHDMEYDPRYIFD
jgi:putative transposase